MIEIDKTGLMPKAEVGYSLTWTPNQAELDRHEAESTVYVCLVREQLSCADFLFKYGMKASHNCVVYFIPSGMSDEQGENWVRSTFDYTKNDLWMAPATLSRGQGQDRALFAKFSGVQI